MSRKRNFGFLYLAMIAIALFQSIDLAAAGIDETYQRQGANPTLERLQRLFGENIFGRSYAVVIGVSNYDNFPLLDAPSADALKMRDFLKNEADFDYIVTLTDERASKSRISALMEEELPKRLKKGDRLLFYFSGHAVTRTLPNYSKRGYLVLTKSSGDWDSMIDMPTIKEWEENAAAAKHILFMLDACFSGLAAMQFKSSQVEPPTVQQLSQPASYIVTSGTENQDSYSYNGSSIFTDAFLKAARGEYGNAANGLISLGEIMYAVRNVVAKRMAEIGSHLDMTPQMYVTHIENNAGEFFFFVNNAPVPISEAIEQCTARGGAGDH